MQQQSISVPANAAGEACDRRPPTVDFTLTSTAIMLSIFLNRMHEARCHLLDEVQEAPSPADLYELTSTLSAAATYIEDVTTLRDGLRRLARNARERVRRQRRKLERMEGGAAC
jgi:hypothetical protein